MILHLLFGEFPYSLFHIFYIRIFFKILTASKDLLLNLNPLELMKYCTSQRNFFQVFLRGLISTIYKELKNKSPQGRRSNKKMGK